MKRILYLLILLSMKLHATDYYSISSSDWENSTTWDIGEVPNGTKENIITISSGTTVTATNLSFSKSTTINVLANGTLIINTIDVDIEAAEARKDFTLNIEDNGSVIVNGSLTTAKDATIYVDGDMTVIGDLLAGPGSTLQGSGSVAVSGTVTPAEIANDTQLPIELKSFEVYLYKNYVHIRWSTSSEVSNERFEILHSINGLDWSVIAQKPGAGTSMYENEYIVSIPSKSGYYRLKQVDYDGRSEIFESFTKHINTELKPANVRMYDMQGRLLNNVDLHSKGVKFTGNSDIIIIK